MIDLYTADTANGQRVELMLEELGLEYTKHKLSLSQGDSRTAKFLKLNPSGRIPVIVDHDALNRKSLLMSQSVAILIYLAEKYEEFIPIRILDRAKVMEWLFFIATDVATTSFDAFYLDRRGQADATNILKDRVMEYYAVYNQQLASTKYLAGNGYSIVDIAAYPWAKSAQHKGMKDLTHVQRWMDEIAKRPSIKKTFNLS